MKIEDNFLDQKVFDELQTFMMGVAIDWHYQKAIDYPNEKDKFMFTHMFYFRAPSSQFIGNLKPIIDILEPMSIWRIKANLLTKTSKIIENEFHIDIGDLKNSSEQLKQWTTSIFYINTNNGYTKFEDGSIVESVANRMITFPSNMKHTGTSCTDEKTRIVINFNYFKNIIKNLLNN